MFLYLTPKLSLAITLFTLTLVTFVCSDESNSEKYDKFPGLKLNVEELEMLLEAYFAQTNGILQRLFSVSISLLTLVSLF